MARMTVSRKSKPLEIDKFLGYHNEPTGDTQLKIGESGNMVNYYVTKNWKLKKIEGYKELFATLGERIQGQFYGNVAGLYYHLFASNGNIYTLNNETGVYSSIGTLTDAPTNFFAFGTKVYIQNGVEYKSWDGTTFEDVAGYIPLIAINTPFSGGGTDAEQLNLLTGSKRQWFDGDNAQTTYQLRETNIDSVDEVTLDGVVTTAYTTNLTNGTITFNSAPTTEENNITIQWTKGTGQRSLVIGHRANMLFGPGNDTRVFIFGNILEQHRFRYTGITYEGEPTAEYYPSNNYSDQDSENFAITDMQRTQANYFIIMKENMSRYGRYELLDDGAGGYITVFRTFDLNGVVGNVAFNQAQVLEQTLHSINNSSLHRWDSTQVNDERNAPRISSKVRTDIEALDMSNAITYDWQDRAEWWIAVGKKVFIYNYELMTKSEEDGNRYVGTYSPLELADTPTNFMVIDGKMYFGTESGTIMKFDKDLDDFNGTLINRHWEMNFYDFEANYLRKSMQKFWIQLFPDVRESLDITLETNKGTESGTGISQTIEYKIFNYGDIDYSDWSYSTSQNAQPFRIKRKAKKFTNLKLIFDNTDLDGATVLNITIKFTYQGESK